ncbi:hypothetical protein B1B00_07755 [Bacillus sp. DSM 27956]|nr:hypothetical protein B1B00_07755 [Bacillus sp. DSM 27956]
MSFAGKYVKTGLRTGKKDVVGLYLGISCSPSREHDQKRIRRWLDQRPPCNFYITWGWIAYVTLRFANLTFLI